MNHNRSEISRVTRPRRAAQATYDRISRWYDLLEGRWETPAREGGLSLLAAKPGETLLEVGVGPGHSLMALAQSVGESGKVCGLDLSPKMLAISQARAARSGLARSIALQRGDALQMPYESGAFDAGLMTFTLELFDTPDIDLVLKEFRRVLRAGGRLCVVSLSKAGGYSAMVKLYELGHEHFPNLLDCRPIFVQRALETAGFRIVVGQRALLWGLPVEVVLGQG